MSMEQMYWREQLDAAGRLTEIQFSYPDNFNFGYDIVDVIAAEDPDRRALVWCNTEGAERILSFADIRRCSNQAANVFLQAGIGRGDAVLVALKRHYEYWYVAIALHKIGAVMIPVTHMLTTQDVIYRMRRAAVKGVVCTPDGDVPRRMQEAAAAQTPDCLLWTVQRDVDGLRNLTAEIAAASDQLDRQETAVDDPMLLYFTSGTTGEPKGVLHDFSYPLAHVVTAKYWQQAEPGGLHFTVAETGWAKASWGKLYGQWLVGAAIMVFDFDNFEPKQLVSVINHYGVTSFCAPPTVYRYLTRKGIPPMPSLRHAATAGEQLDPAVSRKFTEQTGLLLREGYGQTETTVLLGNFKGSEPVIGALGTPSPLYQIEIRNPDGNLAEPGCVGEIVVVPPKDGPQLGLFRDYLDEAERFATVWEGGVYHTGDTGWQDENGCFWFHGRADDLIKSGGFRVGPYEVEHVLMEHPAVLECAVVGIPDPARGQAIKAIVAVGPGNPHGKTLERELREFANERLAEYKWIRSIEFVDEIPKTISGKICKAALRRS